MNEQESQQIREVGAKACFLPDSDTEAYCELPDPPKDAMIRPAQKIKEPEDFQAWETLNEWF